LKSEEAHNNFMADNIFTRIQVLGNGDIPGRVVLSQLVSRPKPEGLVAVDPALLGELDEFQVRGFDLSVALVCLLRRDCALEFLTALHGPLQAAM
jgi:hypothetical protein